VVNSGRVADDSFNELWTADCRRNGTPNRLRFLCQPVADSLVFGLSPATLWRLTGFQSRRRVGFTQRNEMILVAIAMFGVFLILLVFALVTLARTKF
jgi:hypothetical protein